MEQVAAVDDRFRHLELHCTGVSTLGSYQVLLTSHTCLFAQGSCSDILCEGDPSCPCVDAC